MRLVPELKVDFFALNNAAEIAYIISWAEENRLFARELANRLMANVRVILQSQGWSRTAVERFLREISVQWTPTAVLLKSRNPILNILELGRRASKPRALVGKVVPLRLRNGMLIFRKVTTKSLLEGKWRVPARPGLFLLKQATEDALAETMHLAEMRGPEVMMRLRQLVADRLPRQRPAEEANE